MYSAATATSSCAGKWYLPAGRMEAGETIVVRLKGGAGGRRWNASREGLLDGRGV